MDCRNGRIYDLETMELPKLDRSFFKQMEVPPTLKQMARKPPRVGRNDLCPCGSGKKFKACCLRDPKDERVQ